MKEITIAGRKFTPLLPEQQILDRTAELAKQIAADCEGKNPLFLVNLSGAMFFGCELLKRLPFPCESYPIKFTSYVNNVSSNNVTCDLFPDIDLRGRDVYVIEDVVDSGLTMVSVTDFLKEKGCNSCKFVTMLVKPKKLKVNLYPDYVGFEIGDEFVAGFGLDVDYIGRNLPDIYKTDI